MTISRTSYLANPFWLEFLFAVLAAKSALENAKMEAEDWTTISSDVKKVKTLLLAFEDNLQQREEKYRPSEI